MHTQSCTNIVNDASDGHWRRYSSSYIKIKTIQKKKILQDIILEVV